MIANNSVGNYSHLLNKWSTKLAEVCSHLHSCFYHSLVQRLLDPKLKDGSLKKKSVTRSLVLSLGTVNVSNRLLFVGYLTYIMSEDTQSVSVSGTHILDQYIVLSSTKRVKYVYWCTHISGGQNLENDENTGFSQPMIRKARVKALFNSYEVSWQYEKTY